MFAARGKSGPSSRRSAHLHSALVCASRGSLRSIAYSRVSLRGARRVPQTLVVPLTGKRVRDIADRAALPHAACTISFSKTTQRRTCRPATFRRCGCAIRRPKRFPTFASSTPTRSCALGSPASSSATRATSSPIRTRTRSHADYHVWERKWEVDSLAWPVILASIYWRSTRRSRRSLRRICIARCASIVDTYGCEERHRDVQPLSLSRSSSIPTTRTTTPPA